MTGKKASEILMPADEDGELNMQPAAPVDPENIPTSLIEQLPAAAARSFKDLPAMREDPRMPVKEVNSAERQRSRRVAERIVAERQAQRREQHQLTTWDDTVISYVECQQSGCLGPGIWIHGNPNGPIDGNWQATYHPKDAYWPPQEVPFCQMCFERSGIKNRLRMFKIKRGPAGGEQTTIGLTCNERFVRTLTRAQYDELVGQTEEEPAHA